MSNLIAAIKQANLANVALSAGAGAIAQEVTDSKSAAGMALTGLNEQLQSFANVSMAAQAQQNNQIQFSITNGAGVPVPMRLGSFIGRENGHLLLNPIFGIPGVAENGLVTDQNGKPKALFAQFLSEYFRVNMALISSIQIISTDAVQLAAVWTENTIRPDGTLVPVNLVTSASYNMSDQRSNMTKIEGLNLTLNNMKYIETLINTGATATFIFTLAALCQTAPMSALNF